MAIGFAAFSQQLKINGTSTTGNRGIIEGLASTFAAQNPAGSCSADGSYGGCNMDSLYIYAHYAGGVEVRDYVADKSCMINADVYGGDAACY